MNAAASNNAVQGGAPSQTAMWVAVLRGAHQLLDEPIVFNDPLALAILGPELEAVLRDDPFAYNDLLSRGLRAALAVRSAFAEEELARCVASGVRQYVVLGAGLDTSAYRNRDSVADLVVFEVDHPSTQGWKRRQLADAGIAEPQNLRFAPVDFERETLAEGLSAVGFRADRPAFFSWLGVTMYLTDAAITQTLRFVAGCPEGTSIVLDFRAPASMMNPIEHAISQVVEHRAAALGEPMISAFEPEMLEARLLDLGFAQAKSFSPDALNRRYLYRRKDGLHSRGRILCATV